MANLIYVLTAIAITLTSTQSLAAPSIEDTAEYANKFDESITFFKMTYLPSVDNVNGIFAKSLDEKTKQMIEANHRWDFTASPATRSIIRPEDLVNDAKLTRRIAKNMGADGFFITEVRKDPKNTKVHLYLFSSKSGRLMAEEEAQINASTTQSVHIAFANMMSQVVAKIPYDGMVVSRTDNRVTLNVGSADGVTAGQTLNTIKIISAKQHPKRGFIIKSNKALIGQVRIVKADKYLSFADVLTESEPGVIDRGVKVTGITRVNYGDTLWTRDYTPPAQLLSKDNKSVYGKDAQEWVAKDPPTFGKVGANFSLGSFDNSLSLTDGTNARAKSNVYPRFAINGEIWVTPTIYTSASFAQGAGSSPNPVGGSELSNSLTQYRMSVGYTLLLRDDFFGPKLKFDLGFSGYKMFIDSTAPTGFTTVEYSSVPIGIGGYTPINKSRTWAIGGMAYFHLFPSIKEATFSSGASSDSSINEFNVFAEYSYSQRLKLNIGLEFNLLSTNFSGQGTRPQAANDLSHRFTMLTTGIDYLF